MTVAAPGPGDVAADIRARIADLVDGSPRAGSLAVRIIVSFVDTMPELLGELVTSARDGDPALVASRAHRLKGAAANLGVTHLARLCAEVERLAESGRLAEAVRCVGSLDAAFTAARGPLLATAGELRAMQP